MIWSPLMAVVFKTNSAMVDSKAVYCSPVKELHAKSVRCTVDDVVDDVDVLEELIVVLADV